MADLGEEPGGPGHPPYFWIKKEEMTERKKACRVFSFKWFKSQSALTQHLNLKEVIHIFSIDIFLLLEV